MKLLNFIKYYLISMRLHFGFITGMGGMLGISYYEHLSNSSISLEKKIFAIIVLFLSYGINQIINDYTGIEEDKINAPNRPMVSGKLAAKPALWLSICLMAAVGLITLVIAPLAIIPVIAGVLINYLYEYAKSVSILGNIFFGLSMMSCPVYGFLMGDQRNYQSLPYSIIIGVIFLLSYTTGLMTYFTYFKDHQGDKIAGKKTYIVRHGVDKSKRHGIIFSLLPVVILAIFFASSIFPIDLFNNTIFIFLLALTLLLQIWTAFLYYFNPFPPQAFFQQRENIQACVQSIVLPIACYNSQLALILSLISFIGIEILFNLHRDAEA